MPALAHDRSPLGTRSLLSALLIAFALFAACTKPIDIPPIPSVPDTTSHDFTWQIDTLGDGNSSILYDVAIIDENNIWAVGELYVKDESGQINSTPYGLAKWNGTSWSLETVAYHDYGSTLLYPGPIFAIQSFGPNDVYVCSYANLLHWDGSTWSEKAFFMTSIPFENQIQKMWGSDGSNIYCVGRKGGIFHFNGSAWTQIESGTTIDLVDIIGTADVMPPSRFVIGSSGYDRIILQIRSAGVSPLWDGGIPIDLNAIRSIWHDSHGNAYTVGRGMYQMNLSSDSTWERVSGVTTTGYLRRIRGAYNDLFVVGTDDQIIHFNGNSWMGIQGMTTDFWFHSVDVSFGVVAVVGYSSSHAAVLRGHRVN